MKSQRLRMRTAGGGAGGAEVSGDQDVHVEDDDRRHILVLVKQVVGEPLALILGHGSPAAAPLLGERLDPGLQTMRDLLPAMTLLIQQRLQ